MSDHEPTLPLQPGPTSARPATRDKSAAQTTISEMVARAQAAERAVGEFHAAADEIDEAEARMNAAMVRRNTALRDMRENGLPIGQIAALTGLSESRIQTLLKSDGNGD